MKEVIRGRALAALDAEESALADVVNVQTAGRSWDLQMRRALGGRNWPRNY